MKTRYSNPIPVRASLSDEARRMDPREPAPGDLDAQCPAQGIPCQGIPCPECGAPTIPAGGCWICPACGWEACGW